MHRSSLFLAALLALSLPAGAQSLLTEYGAYIGAEDLTNSNGARLSQPWQVLRQDRANLHRFGVTQPGDDWDPIFSNFENRARLEELIRAGFISGAAADAILRGDVRVRVRVFGFGSVPQRLEVEVWNESEVTAGGPSTVVPAVPPEQEVAPEPAVNADYEPEI